MNVVEAIREKLIRLTDNDDSSLFGREEAVQEVMSIVSEILQTEEKKCNHPHLKCKSLSCDICHHTPQSQEEKFEEKFKGMTFGKDYGLIDHTHCPDKDSPCGMKGKHRCCICGKEDTKSERLACKAFPNSPSVSIAHTCNYK